MKQDAIKISGDKQVRAIWDGEQEKWYFSVVDIIAVLTNSPNPPGVLACDEEKVRR